MYVKMLKQNNWLFGPHTKEAYRPNVFQTCVLRNTGVIIRNTDSRATYA